MNRKSLLISGTLASAVAAGGSVKTQAADKHPNVVFVMSDDQGYANLSCVGNPVLKTPNIDNFYKKSVRLTDFHVDPTCAPSRSAFLTGRYSDRVGVWHTIMARNLLRRGEITMANVFKDSGYTTGIFGKWHVGDAYPFRPQDRGFDHVVIHGGGGIGQTPDFWGNDYFDDVYQVDGKRVRFKGYCTDIFFDEAMKFIKSSESKPFFVYLVTNAPHGPNYAPDKYSQRFMNQRYKGIKIDKGTANYYGMIENLDYNFGKLMQFLKNEHLLENTVVIFTTDNGGVRSAAIKIYNAGLRGHKGEFYDGGHRVPFFISWPDGGIDGGVDVSQVTAHIDILPTLIDLCHLKKPDVKFDGKSLVPLLKNPSAEWPDRRIVVESQRIKDPQKYRKCSVMTNKWRLCSAKGDAFELYDMTKDRGQQNNIVKANPETVKSLKESYDEFWNDVSRRHGEISRFSIGAPQENPTMFTAHDWFGASFFSQKSIANLKCNFPNRADPEKPLVGAFKVYVERDGWYQISLRRWPAEADKPINAAYIGKSIHAKKAVLEIEGQKLTMDIPENAKEVTFRVKLKKGNADLVGYFITDQKPLGAFYVYVLYEGDKPVKKGWQTREALGLPEAVWPAVPGKDTTK